MIGVAGNQLWHTIRHADGSWQPSFGLVEGQESSNPGPFGAISCAGVGVPNGTGPATVEVPDVVELLAAAAEKAVTKVGLSYKVEYAKDGLDVGTVRSQDPTGGTMVTAGSVITLVAHAPDGRPPR